MHSIGQNAIFCMNPCRALQKKSEKIFSLHPAKKEGTTTHHVWYKIDLSICIIVALCAMIGCGAQNARPGNSGVGTFFQNAGLTLTLEELRKYDGRNGNPAYVAVDGMIYDATDVPQRGGGYHNGFHAGNDLTSEIKTIAPHGVPRLSGVPVVGCLAE